MRKNLVHFVLLSALLGQAESASLPVLPVKNLDGALAFWREKIGIDLEREEEAELPAAAVHGIVGTAAPAVRLVLASSKGKGLRILFAQGACAAEAPPGSAPQPPRPLAAYLELPDISGVRAAFPSAASITVGPRCYVFVADPDGNRLCFAGRAPQAASLFNGKDLTGWHPFRQGAWKVEAGVLVAEQGPENGGGWLVTDEAYGDFTLSLSFRLSGGANSGVCVRYPGDGPPPKVGAEIQLSETDPNYQTGSIFDAVKAPRGVYREGWNEATVSVRGKTIVSFLNGREVARATIDRLLAKGHIALQIHGGPEYAGTSVEFKDIRLAEE